MEVKTSDLTLLALDWAVQWAHNPTGPTGEGWYERDENGLLFDPLNEYTVSPSTIWAQGGPIIEREKIETRYANKQWCAWHESVGGGNHGSTPLIAAMRCYVASKLGDTVDVPDELLGD
jgi:hypothetical protein